jgi:hypothetical protein
MSRRTTSMLAGAVIAASPVMAVDLPHRKPGLWEVSRCRPSCGRHSKPFTAH